MHSGRIRTGRSLTVCQSLLPEGGAWSQGVCGPGGCLVPGGVCSRGGLFQAGLVRGPAAGGSGIPARTEADPHPPP